MVSQIVGFVGGSGSRLALLELLGLAGVREVEDNQIEFLLQIAEPCAIKSIDHLDVIGSLGFTTKVKTKIVQNPNFPLKTK